MACHELEFLRARRDVNKAFARVAGGKVNGGAGYGLEIPCVYQFQGPKPCIDKLQELLTL